LYNLHISKTPEAKLNKLKKVDKGTLISISKKVREIQKDPYQGEHYTLWEHIYSHD